MGKKPFSASSTDGLHMIKISIVDSSAARRKKLVQGFRNKSIAVNEYHSRAHPESHTTDILMVHYEDDMAAILNISRSVVVYYGGAGEPDGRWDSRRDQRPYCHRFWSRPIYPTGSGSLTDDEISELVLYASAIMRGEANIKVPAFLQPPPDYSTLIALSILCQGYLAAFAPSELGLDAALNKLIKEAGAEANIIKAGAGWWLDLFGVIPESGSDNDKILEAANRLLALVKNEWTWSEVQLKPVIKLLSLIGEHSRIDETVVKSAFDKISEFLRKSGEL